MAIQQIIQAQIFLQGDGVATTFVYSFNQLFGLAVTGFNLINPNTLPNAILGVDPDGSLPNYTPTLDGFGNLVLTFDTPFTVAGTATLQLVYNSGTLAGTTQAWTSATATNSTWTLPLNGQNNVALGVLVTGTVSAGVMGFQGSQDGANWYTIQGAQSNAYTALTAWNAAIGTTALEFDTAGFSYFRVILSTPISGTGTVTFIIQSSSVSLEPVPTVGQSNAALLNATVVGTTLTKGTQGSTGFSVQDLKDSGRTYITLYAQNITGVTTEALATFTKNVGGTTTTGQTAYTITSGKTFRIQALSVQINNTTTTANNIVVNVRSAASVAASSPLVASCGAASAAAVATVKGFAQVQFPDGVEIAGNGSIQIGVSHLENVTTAAIASFTLVGYEY